MSEVILTKDNFQAEVLDSSTPVLVDFWATWCGPCRMLAPAIEQIAEEYSGRLKVGKVNIDDEPELAGQFQVSAIPTVILFKDGKPVDMFLGFRPKVAVEDFLSGKL